MVEVVTIALGFVQLVVGLIFAAASIYIGVRVFDRFTKGIDEMEELRRGNVAIGVLLAAVVVTVAIIVQSGVAGLTDATLGLGAGRDLAAYVTAVVGGFIQLIVGIILAVVAIFLALNIFGRVTKGIDEEAELRKGNVAVAIVLAGFLVAVGFVIQAGVSAISAGFA